MLLIGRLRHGEPGTEYTKRLIYGVPGIEFWGLFKNGVPGTDFGGILFIFILTILFYKIFHFRCKWKTLILTYINYRDDMSLDKVLNYFLTRYVKHSKILHILMISYRK